MYTYIYEYCQFGRVLKGVGLQRALRCVPRCACRRIYLITQERACSSDSRFRRKLSGTTGHRLLETQRPQMLCVAAWVCFYLSTEIVA